MSPGIPPAPEVMGMAKRSPRRQAPPRRWAGFPIRAIGANEGSGEAAEVTRPRAPRCASRNFDWSDAFLIDPIRLRTVRRIVGMHWVGIIVGKVGAAPVFPIRLRIGCSTISM